MLVDEGVRQVVEHGLKGDDESFTGKTQDLGVQIVSEEPFPAGRR